jgi:hypothetical protein
MNSLLSFSHILNNHGQSLSTLNNHASDVNLKLKSIEQKIKDVENIQSKLQNLILSSEGSKSQSLQPSPVSEDRIRIIVKEYVDIVLKNMIESKTTSISSINSISQQHPNIPLTLASPRNSSSLRSQILETQEKNPMKCERSEGHVVAMGNIPEFNNDNNVFKELEQSFQSNIEDNSDIIIEEKKVKKIPGPKKSKK